MKKSKNAPVRLLVETSPAVRHMALKRGRLFAVGENIPVRKMPAPTKDKSWLKAEVNAIAGKSAWDLAHELADKSAREHGQATFVEPEVSSRSDQSRYLRLLNPGRTTSPGRSGRKNSSIDAFGGMAGLQMAPGLQMAQGMPGRRHKGTRANMYGNIPALMSPRSPFNTSPGAHVGGGMGMGLPAIPDPLAGIMPELPGGMFGAHDDVEGYGQEPSIDLELVRKAFESARRWTELSSAKQEMYVIEAAWLLSLSGKGKHVFDSASLLLELKEMPGISKALLVLIATIGTAG